jgi:hypothetical protein
VGQTLIALAETPAQARAVCALAPRAAIVTLGPAVDYWCERAGRAAIPIESICPETELYPLGEQNIDRIEALCDRVDVLAETFLGRFPEHSDLSLRAFFHFLKANCDGIVIRIEQILRAIESLKPSRLAAFRTSGFEVSGITSFDKPAWGLTSRLVPPIAELHGIPIEWYDAREESAESVEHVPVVRAPATSCRPRSKAVQFFSRLMRRSRKTSPMRDEPLLLHALFDDLGVSIVEAWKARGFPVAALGDFVARDNSAADPAWQGAVEDLWQAITGDEAVRELLTHRSVRFGEWLTPHFRKIVLERYPALLADAQRAERRFRTLQRSLIVAGGLVDSHYVIARVAQRWKVPFVSHHYGGFLGFSLLPMHERYDLAECDYFLCGGFEGRNTFLLPSPLSRWNPKVRRARPVAVGLPWVDAGYQRRSPRRRAASSRRVMVVVNATVGDCRYLGYVFPPEIAYWHFTRRVIRELARLGMEVVVKLPLRGRYPQHTPPLEQWLRDANVPVVEVIREVPLSDCLDRADAFVLESPSTPLLHVVATDKPLLLYIDRRVYRLVPMARELLRGRCAVFAESDEEFFSHLPRWAANYPPADKYRVDDRFLMKFLIGRTDSAAAERTARFLERAAMEHPLSDAVLDSISRENTGE